MRGVAGAHAELRLAAAAHAQHAPTARVGDIKLAVGTPGEAAGGGNTDLVVAQMSEERTVAVEELHIADRLVERGDDAVAAHGNVA